MESEQLKDRNSVFSPVVTVWAFLSQVLDPDSSICAYCPTQRCKHAISAISRSERNGGGGAGEMASGSQPLNDLRQPRAAVK